MHTSEFLSLLIYTLTIVYDYNLDKHVTDIFVDKKGDLIQVQS